MNRLKAIVESLMLIFALLPPFLKMLYLLASYKISKFRARRAAMMEFRSVELDDDVGLELLEVVVPDIGGVVTWGNLMRSRNCCTK